jgi:hypothetical protein
MRYEAATSQQPSEERRHFSDKRSASRLIARERERERERERQRENKKPLLLNKAKFATAVVAT